MQDIYTGVAKISEDKYDKMKNIASIYATEAFKEALANISSSVLMLETLGITNEQIKSFLKADEPQEETP